LVSIRSVGAASRVPFAWFSWQLRRNRVLTRIVVAGIALSIAVAVSTNGAAQAGLTSVLPPPASILPQNVGVGVLTRDAVTIDFGAAMDRASMEAALSVRPSQPVTLAWSADARNLLVAPARLWLADQRYLVVVAAGARRADGWALARPLQFSFTTQTAPRIVDFAVRVAGADTAPTILDSRLRTAGVDMASRAGPGDGVAPPADVAADISASTAVTITFGTAMNHRDVERGFAVSPAVPGTFHWDGASVTFRPDGRLVAKTRYAVSLAGVHDASGNPLGGDTSFSFTTRPGAQLVKITPAQGAVNVTDGSLLLWFSQPMNSTAVGAALKVTDLTRGLPVAGKITWNKARTHLSFAPSAAFAAGHHFGVRLVTGSADADGNALTAAWSFSTKPSAVYAAGPRPAPSADAVTYALNQINASRSAYGLGPLSLSAAISAVAAAHAWDQMENGYFSHTGLNGSTTQSRLRAAGISFSWSGENECTYSGLTNVMSVLDYCHRVFMSEPYPGYANHIGNILSTHYHKVGIGIAQSGSHVIIVWDFTD
jgi:uncharacterized protein YkwD